MDESVLRQQLERFFEYAGADVDRAGELDHEDPCWSFRSALSASRIARQCGAPGLRRSPYANPFPVKTYGLAESLRRYRIDADTFDPVTLRRDLAGKDLACWCPLDQRCHADVLLELANA